MIQIQLQRHDPQATFDASASVARAGPFEPFGKDGLTFGDLVDVINPLQHIPLVGAVYRKLTGDTIDPAMRVAGGALFGGPIGAAVSLAAVVVGEARKDATAEAIEPQLADRAVRPTDDRAYPVFLIKTSHADRPRPETEPTNARDVANTRPDSGREIRRGGWMIAQAYGPVVADSSHENRSNREGTVDLAV